MDLEMGTTTEDVEEENRNSKTNCAHDHALNSNSACSPPATPTVASSRRVWETRSGLHRLAARISHGSALNLHTSSANMSGDMWTW